MSEPTVQNLFEKTEDAYSFGRYSAGGWRQCIRIMRKKGWSETEVEAVLRSKHMRWAGDMSDNPHGYVSSGDFQRYLDRYPNQFTQEKLDDLVEGTF